MKKNDNSWEEIIPEEEKNEEADTNGQLETDPNTVSTETEEEKQKRLAKESQSYYDKKAESLKRKEEWIINRFVKQAENNPDILDTLPTETEDDIEFKKAVEEKLSKKWWMNEYIQGEDKFNSQNIDDTISMLELATPSLRDDEWKKSFKRDFEMLNPDIPHSERVKYVLEKYIQPEQSWAPRRTVSPWNIPSRVTPPVQVSKEDAIKMRRDEVRKKFAKEIF